MYFFNLFFMDIATAKAEATTKIWLLPHARMHPHTHTTLNLEHNIKSLGHRE